jgi:hypothetical protein
MSRFDLAYLVHSLPPLPLLAHPKSASGKDRRANGRDGQTKSDCPPACQRITDGRAGATLRHHDGPIEQH